jgi:hypothetical protein
MNNIAKNKITPNVPSLAESLTQQLYEDFDWKRDVEDPATAAWYGVKSGASAGMAPYIGGAVNSMINKTSTADEIAKSKAEYAQAQKEHPTAFNVGNFGGSVAGFGKLGLAKGLATGALSAAAQTGIDSQIPDGAGMSDDQLTAELQGWLDSQGADVNISGELDDETINAINKIILGGK